MIIRHEKANSKQNRMIYKIGAVSRLEATPCVGRKEKEKRIKSIGLFGLFVRV